MQRKQVRRRRAILGVLILLSLVLLTGYFREGAGGALHSVQRGALEALAPIENGASRALKPVRDLAGWFGSTLHAKSQVKQLRVQRDQAIREAVGYQAALRENAQLTKLVHLDRASGLAGYDPLAARVITRDPTLWYETVQVDKGSGDGVRVNQPVLDGDGLVGKVTDVSPSTSVITLITDHTSGVSAQIAKGGAPGTVVAATGDPNDLVLQYLPRRTRAAAGDRVVTSGTRAKRFQSLFPPNIPIGVVTRVSPGELAVSQQVHLAPYANLRTLDVVQILTRPPGAGAQRAQVP